MPTLAAASRMDVPGATLTARPSIVSSTMNHPSASPGTATARLRAAPRQETRGAGLLRNTSDCRRSACAGPTAVVSRAAQPHDDHLQVVHEPAGIPEGGVAHPLGDVLGRALPQ